MMELGRIAIKMTPGKLFINQEETKIQMERKNIQLEIKSEPVRVLIDQYPSRASAGRKNDRDLNAENADLGKSAALEYMAKTSADGDRKADLTIKGDAIVEIAKRDSIQKKEFNIGFLPKERPKIRVESSLKLDWSINWKGHTNGVHVDVLEGNLDFQYQKGRVEIYIEQQEMQKKEPTKGNWIDFKL